MTAQIETLALHSPKRRKKESNFIATKHNYTRGAQTSSDFLYDEKPWFQI